MSSRNENSCLQTLTIGKPVLLCPGFLSGNRMALIIAKAKIKMAIALFSSCGVAIALGGYAFFLLRKVEK